MADDLVKIIRWYIAHNERIMPEHAKAAADRIEKLEAALEPFANLAYENDGEMYERLAHNLEDGLFIRARKALEGKEPLQWTENYGQGSEPWLKDVKDEQT